MCISEYERETKPPFYGHNMKDLIKAEWGNQQTNKDSDKIANPYEMESKLCKNTKCFWHKM